MISVPLNELLEDLVDLLLPQAEGKGITLKKPTKAFVKEDAALLKRYISI